MDTVIDLVGVSKSYSLELKPWLRLWRQLRGDATSGPRHFALKDINLRIGRGEAVGLIGSNGAGKSTLLQVVCGVLQPSAGQRRVDGRIAALLELGAGFNPELTGRENVRLNSALLGLSSAQIEQRLPEIVDFAAIGAFIDQPVRSYSSGMFVRLAFSMATSVEPDILVIDEALSVGDGAFARKSFERVMALRERGATLLFCSHSLYQVESMCSRAIWIHEGMVRFDGPAHRASVEYSTWMGATEAAVEGKLPPPARFDSVSATLHRVHVHGAEAPLRSQIDDLAIHVQFRSDLAIPTPTVGIMVLAPDGRTLCSAGSWLQDTPIQRDAQGDAQVVVTFPNVALLKGRYVVSAYVLCERGINIYATAEQVCTFDVVQDGPLQGVVALPFEWRQERPGV